jgi:hypothetical protein
VIKQIERDLEKRLEELKKIIIQKMESLKARLRKIKEYDRTRKYDN